MSDSQFFGTQQTEDRSVQTKPVLMFQEEDIPRIQFNGKLLADCDEKMLSQSAINMDVFDHFRTRPQRKRHFSLNEHRPDPANISWISSKSVPSNDKIMFSMPSRTNTSWYTQKAPLRHNTDAILCVVD